jgi:hypothetical protein
MMATSTIDPRSLAADRPTPLLAARWLGSLLLLALDAAGAAIRSPIECARAVTNRLGWILTRGVMLVVLIHLPFGSFLSMQAYFSATFTEAAGAVTILGFVRFVAPFLTSFVMLGLLASRLLAGDRDGCAENPGFDAEDPALDTASWAIAGGIGGILLASVGLTAGSCVGAALAHSRLSVPWMIFVGLAIEMFSPRDAWTLIIQAAGFPILATFVLAHEAVWSRRRHHSIRIFRAAGTALVVIQLLNAVWFQMAYLAGSPFGPRVVATSINSAPSEASE